MLEYELESESDNDKPEEIKEQVQVKKTLNSRQPKIEENHREKQPTPKKHHANNDSNKNRYNYTPQRKEVNPLEQHSENTSSVLSKPQKTSAKPKPFSIRDNKTKDSPEKGENTKVTTSQVLFDSENNKSSPRSKVSKKFDESDVKLLSNTHVFDRPHEGIDAVASQNIRKSMNNLKYEDDMQSKKMVEDRYNYNASKQSITQTLKQAPVKSPMNNSSSQSSIGQVAGIMDLGNKKKIGSLHSAMNTEEERRHETLKPEKQTTKPLLSKTSQGKPKQSEALRSYDDSSSKPSFTANTIVSNHPQSDSESDPEEAEEQKHIVTTKNTIKVEKQESSSEEEQAQEAEDDNAEQSDEDEFPVALNGLVFSFLPQEVAEKLNSPDDWKKRTYAIQETENLIKKQFARPNEDFPIYITDICKKMCKMMHDSNFKISLTSLRIIHNLCMKYPKEILN